MAGLYAFAQLVHVVSAAVWVGGLVVFQFLVPGLLRGDEEAARLAASLWRRWRVAGVAAFLAAGVAGAYMGFHWGLPSAWLCPCTRSWALGLKTGLWGLSVLLLVDVESMMDGCGPRSCMARLGTRLALLGAVGLLFPVLGWLIRFG